MANVWLNNYSDKLISKERTGNGKNFRSILFHCDVINGLASVTVSPKQIRSATRMSGEPIEGYSCILLGDPNVSRIVSYRDENNVYQKISMTVQQIFDSIEANRAEWKAQNEQSKYTEEAPIKVKMSRKATKAVEKN